MVKKISVLGSTGSIGVQTLDIARRLGLEIRALAAGNNIDILEEQINEFRPELVSVFSAKKALELKDRMKNMKIEILSGEEGTIEVAKISNCDMVMASIVGMAGLVPTLEAIKLGRRIGLANKETLVNAGDIIMKKAKETGSVLLPVDSEHSAVFQCIEGNKNNQIKKVILTASGGPFRGKSEEELKKVTIKEALKHPNWVMGSKITIDSATLMNKGLEVIEAHHLFNVNKNQIDVIVHPQSIIHSMVEYIDGSVIAQLGMPDMRTPIQYAITYPERRDDFSESLNFLEMGRLEFLKPDVKTFKCLQLAYDAMETGGSMPCIMNAANEIVVEYFLKGLMEFYRIPYIIEKVMNTVKNIENPKLEDILEIDRIARRETITIIKKEN